MSTEQLVIIGIIFLASFVQSVSGFGMVLTAVSLLPTVMDIHMAVPLAALLSFTLKILLLTIYRHALNLRAVVPLIIAALLSIPIGIWAFEAVDEKIFKSVLGVFLIVYALYALLSVQLPELRHPAWAYVFGVISGILSGAYAVAGPPVVIYGTCRRWQPAEFKANLQGYFLVVSSSILVTHALSHNLTSSVQTQFGYGIIPMALGAVLGTSLDRFIDTKTFQKLVLWLLLMMGIRLVISNL